MDQFAKTKTKCHGWLKQAPFRDFHSVCSVELLQLIDERFSGRLFWSVRASPDPGLESTAPRARVFSALVPTRVNSQAVLLFEMLFCKEFFILFYKQQFFSKQFSLFFVVNLQLCYVKKQLYKQPLFWCSCSDLFNFLLFF